MHYKRCEICEVKSGRNEHGKRLFLAKFPLDEARCKLWVKVVGKEDLAYVPIEKLHMLKYICGKHFKPKDFKKKKTQLKKSAVPSVGLTRQLLSDDILVDFPLHIAKNEDPNIETNISSILGEHNYNCSPSIPAEKQPHSPDT